MTVDLQWGARVRQILREAKPVDPNVIRTDAEKDAIDREGFDWLVKRIQEHRSHSGRADHGRA